MTLNKLNNVLKSKFQIFVEKVTQSFLSLIKVFILSNWFLPKIKIANKKKKVIILGNGPSLADNLENNYEFLSEKDLFVVNLFWKSPYFTKLKPKYYIIIGRTFWTENQISTNKEDRLNTFKEIGRLVDWEMYLFVPTYAKKNLKWKQEIGKNKNIKVYYINLTPIEGFNKFSFFLFKKGFGMPRPHNILVSAIKLAIDLKYPKIIILGADHSWFRELYVAEDNTVYLEQKHFYNLKSKPIVVYRDYINEVRTLAEILSSFVYAFNSYFILNDYAKSKDIKVLNATKGSFIDAFDRCSIQDIE